MIDLSQFRQQASPTGETVRHWNRPGDGGEGASRAARTPGVNIREKIHEPQIKADSIAADMWEWRRRG